MAGTLVPSNTHASLTLAARLSIAVHMLQSFMLIAYVVRFRWGYSTWEGSGLTVLC